MTGGNTHFGFKTVQTEEKTPLVRAVFERVAPHYDLMNDLMSLGLHRLWKRALIGWLNPTPQMHLLDVAGGTGDIAQRFLEASRRGAAHGRVTICDINPAMLREGQARAIDRNHIAGMEWACGNAETLPFPDRYFDAYTIAFGIRNVTHIDRALKEAYRVLKPGGHFLCLEFSQVEPSLLGKLYDWYSFHVIPRVGLYVAGDGDPYHYLVESIRRFPTREDFAAQLRDAGFSVVSHRAMSGGIVAIHSAWRI